MPESTNSKSRSTFYKENELPLPKHPQFRQFKFLLSNGAWHTVKDRIRAYSILRSHITKIKPLKVYYSLSEWLDPTVLGRQMVKGVRPGYVVADSILLGSDLILDIDAESFKEAKRKALLVEAKLTAVGFDEFPIYYSGTRGFHIYIPEWTPHLPSDPRLREDAVKKQKQKFIDDFEMFGEVDVPTAIDPRRIIKLPESLDAETGRVCTRIKNLKSITLNKIPIWGRATPIRGMTESSSQANHRRVSPRPQHPSTQIISGITSKIPGTKDRSILMPKWQDLNGLEETIKETMSRFQLPDFYLFHMANEWFGVCLKALQKIRVAKILRFLGDMNGTESMIKYGQSILPTKKTNTSSGESQPLTYLNSIMSDTSLLGEPVSQPHLSFIRQQHISTPEYPNLVGTGEVEMFVMGVG